MLVAVCCLLFAGCPSLVAVRCLMCCVLLFVVHRLVCDACWRLLVGWSVAVAVCCLLCCSMVGVRCVLFAVRCELSVV